MKKWVCLFLVSFTGMMNYAQILKATSTGFMLVTDSISDKKISNDTFDNFKGRYRYSIRNNENWFQENEGKYFIPGIEYDSLIVLSKNGHWGCINLLGKEKISFTLSDPVDFFKQATCFGYGGRGTYQLLGGSQLYNESDKYGYKILDWKGNLITTYVEMIDNTGYIFLMASQTSDKCGIITADLDTLSPFEYGCTSWDAKNFYFTDLGYLAIKNAEGKCGVIDKYGKIRIPFEYDYICDPHFDYNPFTKDKLHGLMDMELNIIVPAEYDELQLIGGPVIALGLKNGVWTIIDSTNKKLSVEFTFVEDNARYQEDGMIVSEKNRFGLYMMSSFSYQLEPIYDTLIRFRPNAQDYYTYNYLAVKGTKTFVFDNDLKLISEFSGKETKKIEGSNLFLLTKGKKKYLADNKGVPVSGGYDNIIPDTYAGKSEMFFVTQKKKYGWINAAGAIVIPAEYDAGCEVNWTYNYEEKKYNGTISLLKGNQITVFDMEGKIVETKTWNKYGSFCDQK